MRSCDGATTIFKFVIGKDSHTSLAFRKGPARLLEGLFEVFDEALALSELEIIRKRGENLEQYRGRTLLINSEPKKARAVIFVDATARVF